VILKVGLTGGIASGKSTAREIFGSLGCHVIDAEILREDQTIDRVKLADIAFARPDDAKKLNALIHPIVLDYTAGLIAEYERTHGDEIVVVEATLLLEAGARTRYDRVVVVDVDPIVQIERGIARGLTHEEVTRRIANQMPRDERLRQADYVIDNSGDRARLMVEVRRVWEALRGDLLQKRDSTD
jgi:dephospho-CoA kinase